MAQKRYSIELTIEEWRSLDKLALSTNSKATRGGHKDKGSAVGLPSWRALIRRIAKGEIKLIESVGQS